VDQVSRPLNHLDLETAANRAVQANPAVQDSRGRLANPVRRDKAEHQASPGTPENPNEVRKTKEERAIIVEHPVRIEP
jgi:hypothetical protein